MGLGGQSDATAIRGVQRSYSRSEPGALLGAVARARKGVVLPDELDKACQTSRRGDPTAALLEVFDPAHNHSFRDDFFDLPVDLSSVMFVVTTNRAARPGDACTRSAPPPAGASCVTMPNGSKSPRTTCPR